VDKKVKTIENRFENMTGEELRKEILIINEQQITHLGYISLFEILIMYFEFKKAYKDTKELIEKLGSEKEEIDDLYKKLEERVENLDILFDKGYIDDSLRVDYFRNLRDEAYNIINGISGYLTEITYAHELANSILLKEKYKDYKNYQITSNDLQNFYQKIYNFIIQDRVNLYERASRIISVLPVRISRNKFYDILNKALVRDLQNASKKKVDLIIDRYKSIFNGTLDGEYGSKFDYFFTSAQHARLFDYKTASIEDIEQFSLETSEALNEVYSIINLMRQYGLIVNRFIIVSTVKEHIKKNKLNYDIDSILKKCSALITSKEDDTSLEICENYIKEMKKRISISNKSLETVISEYVNRSNTIDDELNTVLLKTQNILAYYNDYYLENEGLLLAKEEAKTDKNYLEQAVDNFIQFIDRNIKDMPNMQRKIRMRRILSAIKIPFPKPDEFFEYVKNSMEINTTTEEKLLAFEQVNNIISLYENSQKKRTQ
jgi:hypothetical protein